MDPFVILYAASKPHHVFLDAASVTKQKDLFMSTFKNIFFVCSLLSAFFSAINAEIGTPVYDLPAVTIQVKNITKIQGKYAVIHSEQNFGLWITLNKVNNELYYKIIQEPGCIGTLNIDKTVNAIKAQINEHKESIKEYLRDIVDFQEAKYYSKLLSSYFSTTSVPTVVDLNDFMISGLSKIKPVENKKIFSSSTFNKEIKKNSEIINQNFELWQRKYGISDSNMKELNGVYQSLQKYIDDYMLSDPKTKYFDELRLSFDPDKNYASAYSQYTYTMPNAVEYDYHKPFTMKYACISNSFYKEICEDPHVLTENVTSLGFYCYAPEMTQNASSEKTKVESLLDKVNGTEEFLKKNKRKSIFRPDAGKIAKENADKFVGSLVKEIKKQQQNLNKEIDGICTKLKNIF